jgi:hypothetical protein
MFCAHRLIFGGIEGVRSHFHVLHSQTRFRRYRECRVSFSCFALQDSFWRYRGRRIPFSCVARTKRFSTVPRASGPVLMFRTPGLVFGGSDGVRSSFQVLRAQTHFRRYRGHPVLFSCFALQDMFSAVPRMSGSVYMFCAPGHVFDGTEGVGSRFQILRVPTRF